MHPDRVSKHAATIVAVVLAVKRGLPLMQFMQWGWSHEFAGCRVCLEALMQFMTIEMIS